MIIDFKNIEGEYIYLERYVNDESPSGFSANTTSSLTAPKGSENYIELLEIVMQPNIKMEAFGQINNFASNGNTIIIHPDMLYEEIIQNNIQLVKDKIIAYPTASGRTVKVAGKDIFIKLTYNRMLGRMVRQIAKNNIIGSLETSMEISQMLSNLLDIKTIGLFEEFYGKVAYLPNSENTFYEWGYIIRNSRPFPYSDEEEFLIPCFSLFSTDTNSNSTPPILIQLIQKQKEDPITYILENLIFPIYDAYFTILLNCGIGIEGHSQNMLIAINKDFKITRVIVRDLESAYCDIQLRAFLGLKFEKRTTTYKCIHESDNNYNIMHSFMFDFKLGEYLITPILNCLSQYYPLEMNVVALKIKNHNQAYIKRLPKEYFPKTWFNYENRIFEPDVPRPYISNLNPKYRFID